MRRIGLAAGLVAILACAKPAVEQGSSGVPVDAPAPGSCPASKVREVRYGGTVDKRVALPAKIASRRCVDDLRTKLEADVACAQAFNEASWGHALHDQGLALIDAEPAEVWIEGAQYHGGFEYGSVHPHPDEPDRQIVFLGLQGSDCSGTSTHTQVSPGIQLARNRVGEVVVVLPKPTVEARSYARCSCDPGCGAMMEPMASFAALPPGAKLGQAVELVYPAISISSHAVENTSCCCAP